MRREVMTCDNCGENREPESAGRGPLPGFLLRFPGSQEYEFCSLPCVGEFVHPAAIAAREQKEREQAEWWERWRRDRETQKSPD